MAHDRPGTRPTAEGGGTSAYLHADPRSPRARRHGGRSIRASAHRTIRTMVMSTAMTEKPTPITQPGLFVRSESRDVRVGGLGGTEEGSGAVVGSGTV